jgi:hypothetical protein
VVILPSFSAKVTIPALSYPLFLSNYTPKDKEGAILFLFSERIPMIPQHSTLFFFVR